MNTGNERSRGYYKIEGAARAFNFDFRDKIVLDIGSSTGGFTKYALDHGAKKVIAVERGTNQMPAPLRHDERIELHEKTDIFNFKCTPRVVSSGPVLPNSMSSLTLPSSMSDLTLSSPISGPALPGVLSSIAQSDPAPFRTTQPDIILADVSFLPLTKILKYAKLNLSRSDTDFLVMLKPQFETSDPKNDLRNGIVKNESTRRRIIKNFESWLRSNGFLVIKKRDNLMPGKHGNIERFYHLRLAK